METLTDVIKKAVIDDMKRCSTIYTGYSSVSKYFVKNLDTLKLLYDNKILTDSDIDQVIKKNIIKEAEIYLTVMKELKKDTNHALRRDINRDASSVMRREFLAYAIQQNAFSKREIKKIIFDPGETAEIYSHRYGKPNLIENIKMDLFNPKPSQIESFMKNRISELFCSH